MKTSIELTVNGNRYPLEVDTRERLMWALVTLTGARA